MSRVHGVVPKTTLLDTLMALHGASGVTTESEVQAHLNLSCQERAKRYHQISKKLHEPPSIHDFLTTVEQALAQPPSNGSESTT